MLKNMISYIFIYMMMISCDATGIITEEIFTNDDWGTEDVHCDDCQLIISMDTAQDHLWFDDSLNVYHWDYNENYEQMYGYVFADVGHDSEFVGWDTDTFYCWIYEGERQCDDVINGSSYSDYDGVATQVMIVVPSLKGREINVYAGYYNLGIQYLDSIKIIVDP
tara:strand:+ start:181 stop:675 length:495 start_codon:yes stop_codon:yes gene_type:complete